MTATQQQVQMAAQLYEMRDTAKRLLGNKYQDRMAEFGAALQDASTKTGREPLSLVIEAGTKQRLVGMDLVMMMAAAVELVEPTA